MTKTVQDQNCLLVIHLNDNHSPERNPIIMGFEEYILVFDTRKCIRFISFNAMTNKALYRYSEDAREISGAYTLGKYYRDCGDGL